MLEFLNRLKIRSELSLLIAVLMSGVIFTGLISYWNLQRLKIKGPYYEQIIELKDLLADIKPSRLDITQAYLLAFQEATESNPKNLADLIDQTESFNNVFEQQIHLWIDKLPQENMLDNTLYEIAYVMRDFFDVWRNEFLPAIKKGNKELALNLLHGKFKNLHSEQQLAIQHAYKILLDQHKALETEVEHIYKSGRRFAVFAWLSTIIFTALLAYLIGRSITTRLNSALKRISSASSEINFRMNQQGQSISQQSNSAHETTSAMNELNISFQHTKLLAIESSNKAKNAFKVSEEGNNLIKQMLEGMLEHKNKVLAILDQILHLSEIINRIHNVASTINNLTNQTNILALNAAVQAAHVKQSGEGFSVIASEIRKLADESKKFVSHIDLLVENIKQATDSTVRIAQEGSITVQECIKLAQSSSRAFDTIISITTNSSEGAAQVSQNIEQQSQAVHRVLQTMEILNESAHQSLIDMEKVKSELDKLNQLSEELKAVV